MTSHNTSLKTRLRKLLFAATSPCFFVFFFLRKCVPSNRITPSQSCAYNYSRRDKTKIVTATLIKNFCCCTKRLRKIKFLDLKCTQAVKLKKKSTNLFALYLLYFPIGNTMLHNKTFFLPPFFSKPRIELLYDIRMRRKLYLHLSEDIPSSIGRIRR